MQGYAQDHIPSDVHPGEQTGIDGHAFQMRLEKMNACFEKFLSPEIIRIEKSNAIPQRARFPLDFSLVRADTR